MGGTDRCGILIYAVSKTTDIGLLLVAPATLIITSRDLLNLN
jgi:hypothetical protein